MAELDSHRAQLDALTKQVVESGLATWSGGDQGSLIVRGQSHLLDDVTAIAIPRDLNVFAAYPIGVTTRTRVPELARAWLSLTLSERARPIFERHGFLPAELACPAPP